MKEAFQKLLEQLRSASPAARTTLLGATGLMLLLVGFTTYRATTPHYVLFSSGLDETRFAKVQNALAAEAVDFKFSQPPGPYSIWVDEGALQRATNAVALSPALTPEARGILTDSGMGDAFKDAKTRNAIFWKSQWQEMEKQLEALDFVRQAVVTTSIPSGSPLRKTEPTTVSVTLGLEGARELSRAQSETVATLVRFRFDVPRENVVIADQTGRALYDGSRESEEDEGGDLFDRKMRWEREHREQVMEMLTRMFGEGRALVTLHSEWNQEYSEKVTERIDPEQKAVVQETRNKTKSEGVPAVGGAAGSISNVPGYGTETAGIQAPAADSASTEESSKTTLVSKEWGHTASRTPVMTRLSVALVLDESVDATLTDEKRARLDAAVQSAVGFDAARGDTYESFSTPFASIARDADGKPVEPEPAAVPELPNPMIELLLKHGLEALAGLVFVILLLKTLKGRRTAASAAEAAGASEAVDPELLARAQIDELLRSDPERVGEILSRWATEDLVGARAGR